MEIIELQTFTNIVKSGKSRTYPSGFLINGAIVRPGHLSVSIYSCDNGLEIKDTEHIYFEGCRVSIEYFSPKYIKDLGSQWNTGFIRGKKIDNFDAHRTEMKGELYIGAMPEYKEYEIIYHGDPSNFIIHFDLKEKYSFINNFFEEMIRNSKLTKNDRKYLSRRVLSMLSKDIK